MKRRVAVAAVLGALLVGGAGTGATHARWLDQATQPASSARSGAMAFTAGTSATSLTVARGATNTTTLLTVTDGSQGKNLQQRVTPTVSATNGVTASLLTRSGGSCTATAQAPVVLTPSQAFTSCLSVSVPAGSTATSSTVTITLNGAQVRGASVGGWTYGPRTVTVPVTIPGAVTPVLTCQSPSGATITWNATGSSYNVYETADPGNWPASPLVSGTSATTFTKSPFPSDNSATRYYRVTAVTGGTESPASNVIKIRRSGASANIFCEAP